MLDYLTLFLKELGKFKKICYSTIISFILFMGVYTMKHLLNPSIGAIQISGIRQFAEKMKEYPDVVALTIGEPDFPTPTAVKEAGKQAIDENYSFYAPNAGLLETRQAACSFVERYGLTYNPSDEVIVTNGSTESIYIALKTILLPGDEVIVPTPTYPAYDPVISMSGAKLVGIDVSDTNFKLTKEKLEAAITPKTKAVILPYPSNPTGAILTKSELEELVPVLEKHELFIVSDELYSELVFEEQHASIASFPSLRERTIVINGVSKSHAMTGWRIGFVFAPSYLVTEMLKAHQYVNTSVNTMAQRATVEALNGDFNDVYAMKDEYKKRRDYLHSSLRELGFDVLLPEGTFYIFPDVSKFSESAHDFSLELLEKAKVGLLPSSVFTGEDDKHFRISFSYSMEKIQEVISRLKTYLETR